MIDTTSRDAPIQFSLDGVRTRTTEGWRKARKNSRQTAIGAAQVYARRHGSAAIWRADDSLILFYMDGALRQFTWKHARPVTFNQAEG